MNFLHPPRALLASALILLLGCQAETFGADDIVVDPTTTMLEGPRLPGGHLTLSAPWVVEAHAPVIVVIDGSAEIEATHDPNRADKLTFQLPSELPPGSHRLELRAGGIPTTYIATIRTGGFSAVRYVDGALEGILQPIPGRVALVGGMYNTGGGTDRLGILDLQSARLTFPAGGDYEIHFGVGASTRQGAFTMALDLEYNWRSAGMTLGKLVVDSAPLWGGSLLVHEIGPGIYLDAGEHGLANIWGPAVDGADGAMIQGYGDAIHFAMTGDGRWAIPGYSSSDSGVLIIDRANGRHHWSPRWRVASTAGGAAGELFVLGYRGEYFYEPGPTWLGRIDAATGVLLDSTQVLSPSGEPYVTSTGRVYALESADYLVLVFAVGGEGDALRLGQLGGYWELSIRDPITLAEIAHARSPIAADGCYLAEDPWLVEDPGAHRFHLTAADCSGRTPILTFELPE